MPVTAFGRFADSGIERVGGIEGTVELSQRWLRLVEVADIVLGRVFCVACVKQCAKLVLQRRAIDAFLHQIFLMHHVAQEMADIDLQHHLVRNRPRQGLEPIERVAWQGNVKGNDVFYGAPMNCPVTHHGAAHGKAIEESRLAFDLVAFDEAAGGTGKNRGEIVARLCNAGVSGSDHQVMRIAVPIVDQPFGQVLRQQTAGKLQQMIRDCLSEAKALGQSIEGLVANFLG